MGRLRVRQHVNPLSSKYRQKLIPPDWQKIYQNLSLPIHLDIGCARGRFLLQMAQLQPDINFLGIEIREPLVIEANKLRDEHNLSNLHYVFTNINNNSELLLSSLPKNRLELVTIQFPDPWFKKKHFKRRVVQSELVESLAKYLKTDSQVFLQSDVEEVAKEMVNTFLSNSDFVALKDQVWLEENPLLVKTEREIATINKGEAVYRAMLITK